MNEWKKTTALLLVISLCRLAALQAAAPLGAAETKQALDQFGVGAQVKLKLAGGEKLRGSIESIEDQRFLLAPQKGDEVQPIAYDQVTELQLAKRSYKAAGQPDPIQSKRAVMALGVGQHIMVRTITKQEYHGKIQSIDASSFRLLPDNQPAPVEIAYGDIGKVEKNLSAGATIVLVILIVATVAVLSGVLATR